MKDKTASEQATAAKGQKVRPRGGTSGPRLQRAFLDTVGAVLAPRKDPMRQEQGRKGARSRWGPPGEKTTEQRRGEALARSNNLAAIRRTREAALSKMSKAVGDSAAALLMTNMVLSQGAIHAAEYLVDLVRGRYVEAPHSVRVDAAKAVIDRASTLHGLKLAGNGGSVPLNQWTFQQLSAFVEANDGTVTLEPASDEQSDRNPLLSEDCNDKVQESSETVEQPQQPSAQVMAPVDVVDDASTSPALDPPPHP